MAGEAAAFATTAGRDDDATETEAETEGSVSADGLGPRRSPARAVVIVVAAPSRASSVSSSPGAPVGLLKARAEQSPMKLSTPRSPKMEL